MADDLGYNSIWPIEQNFPFASSHYKNEVGDFFLEKEKASFNFYPEETVQQEESPQLRLDDVLMLDDIREFSMKNDFISAETNFYGDDRTANKEKSPSIPLKATFPSSQFEIAPLKSPDEYLPSSPSEMNHSDTFQDLSNFMPQSSATASTSNSLTVNSYFSSDSSSSSQFSNLHYEDKTLSVVEASSSTEFSSISESTDGKITKCTELKIMKQTRHKDIRKKNNLASQRSRMTRKEREREMENKEKFLEQENQMLRIKVAKLEELTGALKNQLFKSVLGK